MSNNAMQMTPRSNGRVVHFETDPQQPGDDGPAVPAAPAADDADSTTDRMLFRDNKTWSKGRIRRAKIMSMFAGNPQPTRRKVFSELRVSKDFKEWNINVQGVTLTCAKIYNPALLLQTQQQQRRQQWRRLAQSFRDVRRQSVGLNVDDAEEAAEFQRFVARLPDVQRLELEDPEGTLASVPKQLVGQLPKLESLSMTWTKIRTLPVGLFQLPLNSLYLQRNHIRSLDGIERAGSLTILDISNNRVETLPKNFGQLVNLVSVNLAGNSLRELPDSVGSLARMRTLDVSSNRLRSIPDSIGTAIELASLDVSGNQLTALPDALCGLPNLEDLRARGNQLRELPADFGQLRRLGSLLLRNNRFDDVPPQLAALGTLTSLNLRDNQIVDWRAHPVRSLRYLILDNNRLTTVGDGITGCVHLQLLSLKSNLIAAVPPTVARLAGLKSLYVSGNDALDEVPVELSRLHQLRLLGVGSTGVRTIPLEIAEMPSLTTVELDDCRQLDGYLRLEYKNRGLPGLVAHLRAEADARRKLKAEEEEEEESEMNENETAEAAAQYAKVRKNSKPLIDMTPNRKTFFKEIPNTAGENSVAMRGGGNGSDSYRLQAGLSIVPGTSVMPPSDELAAPVDGGGGGHLVHIARRTILPPTSAPLPPLPHVTAAAATERKVPTIAAAAAAAGASRSRPAVGEPIIETLPAFGDLVSASDTDPGSPTAAAAAAAAAGVGGGKGKLSGSGCQTPAETHQQEASKELDDDDYNDDEMAELYAKVSKLSTKKRTPPPTAKKPNISK